MKKIVAATFLFSLALVSTAYAKWDLAPNKKMALVSGWNPDNPVNKRRVFVMCNKGDIESGLEWQEGDFLKGLQEITIKYDRYQKQNKIKLGSEGNSYGFFRGSDGGLTEKEFIQILMKDDGLMKFTFKDSDNNDQSFSLSVSDGNSEISEVLYACNFNYNG